MVEGRNEFETGMQTGDNELFLRFWTEISANNMNLPSGRQGRERWNLYSKGGGPRKWYGNIDHVVDWEDGGYAIRNLKVNGILRSRVRDQSIYFRRAASWSFVSSERFSCRHKEPGVFFDVASSCALEKEEEIEKILGFLGSKLDVLSQRHRIGR